MPNSCCTAKVTLTSTPQSSSEIQPFPCSHLWSYASSHAWLAVQVVVVCEGGGCSAGGAPHTTRKGSAVLQRRLAALSTACPSHLPLPPAPATGCIVGVGRAASSLLPLRLRAARLASCSPCLPTRPISHSAALKQGAAGAAGTAAARSGALLPTRPRHINWPHLPTAQPGCAHLVSRW